MKLNQWNVLLRKRILQWGGLAPSVGLIIWIVLTPLMSTIWNFPNSSLESHWQQTPIIVRSVGRFLVQQGIELNSESAYFEVGRYFFLIYLSMIIGLHVFHTRVKSEISVMPKTVSVSQKVLLISLSIMAIGDFTSYGLGMFSQLLWRIGFALESLVFLVFLVGSIWYGTSLLRAKIGLSIPGRLLIGASLLAPLMAFEEFFIGYLPNGPVLPYILAWSVVGLQTTFRQPIPAMEKVV